MYELLLRFRIVNEMNKIRKLSNLVLIPSSIKIFNPNNIFFYDSLNKKIEYKFIKESDGFAVTTSETREEYVKLFPQLKDKIVVIPPLLNPELEDLKKESKFKYLINNDFIRMIFVGTLYSDIRNPKYFLSALDEASKSVSERIEVNFYGSINDFSPETLEIENLNVSFLDSIDRKLAYKKMQEADVLINIGNQTSYQLPSKLVEYAFLEKPIINFSSIKDDSSQRFLDNHKHAKTIMFNERDNSEAISGLVEFLKLIGNHEESYNNDWLEDYRIKNIINSYENLF